MSISTGFVASLVQAVGSAHISPNLEVCMPSCPVSNAHNPHVTRSRIALNTAVKLMLH